MTGGEPGGERSAEQETTPNPRRGPGRAVRVVQQGAVDDPLRAEVFVHTLTGRERATRALKMLGLLWALALASALLPVLHFVLVPLFLISGPIAAWLAHGREQIIAGGVLPCPDCGTRFDVGSHAVQWPLQTQCPNCRGVLRLKPDAP